MKKAILIASLIICVLGTTFLFAKYFVAHALINDYLEKHLGVRVHIESSEVSFLESACVFRGIILYNPESFEEKIFAHISYLSIHFSLPSLLSDQIRVFSVDTKVDEVTIEKNKEGVYNFDRLNKGAGVGKKADAEQAPSPEREVTKRKFVIDKLKVAINTISYRDATATPPLNLRLSVGMALEFNNIHDFKDLEDSLSGFIEDYF